LSRRGFVTLAGLAGASALGVSGCGWLDRDTDRPKLPAGEARAPVWVRDTPSVDAIMAGPSGTLLTLESRPSRRLVQLDAATGAERWARPVAGRTYDLWWNGADDAFVGENAADDRRDLLCLDAATGRERWRVHHTGDSFTMLLVADGMLLVDSHGATDTANGGTLLALDAATGRERRRTALPQRVKWAIAGGESFITYGWENVTVVDRATGAVRWTARATGFGNPVTRDGVVFSGASGVGVTARETATGTTRWEFPAEEPKSLLATADRLYAEVDDDVVVALDPATGRPLWRIKPGVPGHDWPNQGLNRVDNGTLFISVGRFDEEEGESYGGLAAYDAATGRCRWWYDAGGMAGYTAMPTPGVICLHDRRRSLHAVDVRTGRRLWWYDIGTTELPDSLVAAADLVVGHGFGDHRLFALRP